MLPVVSIVGRPNVGKSTIFNRLIGERKAIVHDEYGVTRDRHYGESYWNGRDFTVIDTGGYLPDDMDVMVAGIREQVHIAIEESDVVLFVVDVDLGINTLDKSVANILRQQDRPVLVVTNKADNEMRRLNSAEFYELGFDELFPISAISGTGTGELMDRLVELLPENREEEKYDAPRLAFIGRPNVGKSSLVNALLNDERSIVTDIAGTTRDSIDSKLTYNNKEYILVDTAGLRKRVKVKENIEFYSTVRTEKAIRECDIAVLILDAERGFEDQDKRVLREAEKFNKGLIIILNKWDLIEDKDTHTVKEFEKYIYDAVPQMSYIPIVTISALNKQRIFKVIELADSVITERQKQISTSELNVFLDDILRSKPLPMKRGKQLKINYMTQVKSNPPVFKFFMNNPQDLPANYRRFIENKLRDVYSFTGVPITLVFRQKQGMTQSNWLHILIAISGVPSLIIFFYIAIRDKSLSRLAFGAAITAYLVGITLSYTTNIKIGLTQEWGNLVAITLTLCALFIIIRNSKPVFARFPIYMTAMPLLGLIFYPIINDAVVVKELLMIIYEGGALLVGLLVIGINQFMLKNRGVLLISILILAFSYSLYWFIDTNELPIQEPLSITLFSIGVLLSSIGFKYISDKEKEI